MRAPRLLEVLELHVLDVVAEERPGARDQHVDRAERGRHLADRARTLNGVAEVARHDVRLPLDGGCGRVERAAVAGDEPDARAERAEGLRRREADAARGARDQHRLPCELRHRLLPRSRDDGTVAPSARDQPLGSSR